MLCDGVCDSNAIRKAVVGKNVWANISSRSNHGQRFVRSGWLFRLICPLLSGPISILELVTKEEWNGKEAQAGRDHRQAA
ncbi:hypothetical protein OIK40_15025 [Erythrobacter sp. sf7]|uniref:Uncharacterized protein n=1 Tax=Erythrobacter fulvus TaxID=2987523 RepID=A0ABT5JTC7_9SPHN|nr:hypothetical protein [Erythrobacter fulvus]